MNQRSKIAIIAPVMVTILSVSTVLWFANQNLENTATVKMGDSLSTDCEEIGDCYFPNIVTVSVGGVVTWENVDTVVHTATSGSPTDGPSGAFDSGLIRSGESFAQTFDEAGTYYYYCDVHPSMKGSVIVSGEAMF